MYVLIILAASYLQSINLNLLDKSYKTISILLISLIKKNSMAGKKAWLSIIFIFIISFLSAQYTVNDISELTSTSINKESVIVKNLVEGGVFEARGERAHRVYRFTAATYRAIGPASAYTRAAGFEPLQQEQMVLAHLRAHGRVTRSEVSELCQLTSEGSKSLLRRLLRRSIIKPSGSGRDTFYELAPERPG